MLDRRVGAGVAVLAVAAAYAAGVGTGLGAAGHRTATGVLDQAEQKILNDSANPVSRAELERAAVQGMLAALDDRWATYYSATGFQRFQDVLDGTYSGVGVWLHRSADGTLRVVDVQPGSPAASAGVRAGDQLVAVGSRPVPNVALADVMSLLRGPAGTEVTVTLRRGSGSYTASLRRMAIAEDDVFARQLAPGIVELRITAFTRGVARWVYGQVALARARHDTGIVVDLRGDPGGLLDEAIGTASAFLSSGPVVSYSRRGSAPVALDAWGAGDTSIPLVLLVDGGTASAAEIVTAALQQRNRALVIGSRTFGKGSVQAPDRLSDGSEIELTIGRYLTPDGASLDGIGVQPDLALSPSAPPGAAEQRALQVLSGMLADAGSTGRG